jgi:hypothetical protein
MDTLIIIAAEIAFPVDFRASYQLFAKDLGNKPLSVALDINGE